MQQEIDRLNEMLSSNDKRYKQSIQENDDLRRRLQELSEVNRKVSEYENRIALMSQEI